MDLLMELSSHPAENGLQYYSTVSVIKGKC